MEGFEDTTKIDCKKIDYNNLSVKEFEANLQRIKNLTKKTKTTKKPSTKDTTVVSINGKNYVVTEDELYRLKNLRSEKSLQKLKDKIMAENEVVDVDEF